MKKILKNKNFYLYLGITILILILNCFVPLAGTDDLNSNAHRFLPFLKKINYLHEQFFYWSARTGQNLLQIMGFFPKIYFNILNTGFFILFIYLIKIYAFGNKKKNICLLLTFLIIINLIPRRFDVFFWMAGSCNHLWGLCILLLIGIPYRYLFAQKDFFNKRKIYLIFFSLLAVLAGLSMENTVIFMLLYMIISTSYYYLKTKKLPLWTIILFIITLLAYIYLLTCSSTKIRIDFNTNSAFNYKLVGSDYLNRTFKVVGYYLYEAKYIIYLTVIIFITYCFNLKRKGLKLKDDLFKHAVLCYLLSYVTLFALVVAPIFSYRAILIIMFFNLVLINVVFDKLISRKIRNNLICNIIIIILIFLSFGRIFQKYYIFNQFEKTKNHYFVNELKKKDNVNYFLYEYNLRKPDDLETKALSFSDEAVINYYRITDKKKKININILKSYENLKATIGGK